MSLSESITSRVHGHPHIPAHDRHCDLYRIDNHQHIRAQHAHLLLLVGLRRRLTPKRAHLVEGLSETLRHEEDGAKREQSQPALTAAGHHRQEGRVIDWQQNVTNR